jgi:hypothetical protein
MRPLLLLFLTNNHTKIIIIDFPRNKQGTEHFHSGKVNYLVNLGVLAESLQMLRPHRESIRVPWGLGVHGDHHALKKKQQGELLGSARHGLTKAINPSPRGPRDPRTWEEEIPDEKRNQGLQRIAATG